MDNQEEKKVEGELDETAKVETDTAEATGTEVKTDTAEATGTETKVEGEEAKTEESTEEEAKTE